MHKLIKKFLIDYKEISKYYNFLLEKKINTDNAYEALLDNYYLIEKYKNNIVINKKDISKKLKKTTDIYSLIEGVILKNNYNINYSLLVKEVVDYQKENSIYFTYNELSQIKNILVFIYINKLKELCSINYNNFKIAFEVSKEIEKIKISDDNFIDLIAKEKIIKRDYKYIFELSSQLNYLDRDTNACLKSLNIYLEENNISLKEVINDQYQERINYTILISNIFSNLKEFFKYNKEDIFKSISKCEQVLMNDEIYNGMSEETKESYRLKITKLARKKKQTEFEYIKKEFEELDMKTSHIGDKLFNKKSKLYNIGIYIFILAFLSIIITFVLSNYFLKSRVISYIILFIPVIYIVIEIINLLVLLNNKSLLPKMDFKNKITDKQKTMIVINDTINDINKLKDTLEKLESLYLTNKDDNLYFSLLANFNSILNEELSTFAVEYIKKINDKYKKNIFYFASGKNKSLIGFNKLLLHKLKKQELKEYFYTTTFEEFREDIKYVIMLDSNTEPKLNSLLQLIATMSHPFSKAILNKEETKVINGYALMQPRLNSSFLSKNKSIYSKLFSDINGQDTSNFFTSSIEQKIFKQSSFLGIGIYDLKVFDKVFLSKITDEALLNSNLINGDILRCAYLPDIVFNYKYPTDYVESSSRKYKSLKNSVKLIPYLFQKKKEKDTILLISKLKIIGSVLEVLLYISLLLVILTSLVFSKNTLFWLVFILLIILLQLIVLSKSRSDRKGSITKIKYLFLRIYILFSTLPYSLSLYLSSFFTSIYFLIFHKNLTIKKLSSNSKINYLLKFYLNFIIGLVLLIASFLRFDLLMAAIGLIYIISPFVLKVFSKNIKEKKVILKKRENEEIKDIAKKTWNYFLENLENEYNYLIPDTYQEIGEENYLLKTSPSDIAFSLTSIICAYSLDFIDLDKAFFYLENIIKKVSALEKWNGHLYSYYEIKNNKVISPKFISSVDSGILSAALITTLEFLKINNNKSLKDMCEKLINEMDFKKLYTKDGLLSVYYNEEEKELSSNTYNSLMSISSLVSYIAISKGDITNEKWPVVVKDELSYKKDESLIFNEGDISSCFISNLFIKNYKNTVLNEVNLFLQFEQNSSIENENKKTNVYPYISLMGIDLDATNVHKNILKFKKLNMLSKYGFYNAYDHLHKKIVKSFSTKHQGMILMAITNYLKDDVVKNYFHKNIGIKSFESLLQEEYIKNKKTKLININSFTNYREYKKVSTKKLNDLLNYDDVVVLSNKRYTLLMDKRGNSFSRYQTLQLNRYRKNSHQDYGMFLYIRDLKNNKIWSNTYAPVNIEPDNYKFSFSNDLLKIDRKDGEIRTKTEIIVSNNYNVEIRKITFFNNSNVQKELELTTYTEPTLLENIDDISDKVVNSMFLKSEILKSTNSLVVKRNIRDYNSYYMINKLFIEKTKNKYSYETNRLSFIGRGNDYSNPISLTKELSNQTGDMLDGILSIRNRIKIEANSKEVVYFISGFGRNIEQINDIANTFNDKEEIEKEFKLVKIENKEKLKLLNINNKDIKLYNTILNNLYRNTNKREVLLKSNTLEKKHLLKFGISGNYPIVLLTIKKYNFELISKFLKIFEYFKNKSLFIDFVFINSEDDVISEKIKKQIDDELYRIYATNSFYHTPGDFYIIDFNKINDEEKYLLEVSANICFELDDNFSLNKYINNLENSYQVSHFKREELLDNQELDNITNLSFDNSYGGFRNNGVEYIINNKNTPTPWSNVISNGCFGTVITNNGCGYSFCYNSSKYMLTSSTNELVINEKSEGFKINGKVFDPQRCIHGFGYSILESDASSLKISVEELVATKDNVKLYIIKLTNKLREEQNIDLSFFVNPVLGDYKDITNKYIFSEFIEKNNYLRLNNTYNDINVFLSSSEKIENVISNTSPVKEIITKINIGKLDTKTIVFTLGCSKNNQELDLVNKYSDINNCFLEKDQVKEKWNITLGKIIVKTPDDALNYMLNGWSLYQTISSRIMSKSSFYQVKGVLNYREQLQDAMNICFIDPLYTKTQILKSAAHQFMDGDVLHVFDDTTNIGLRSRHKDDYLFLVYATINYLETTEDYEILSEEVGFIEGDLLTVHEIEREITFTYSNNKQSLFKHCNLAIDKAMNELGKHNLPLIGNGDFDDDMNEIGIRGYGESVLLGLFLYDIINKFVNVTKKYDSSLDFSKYIEFNSNLLQNINKYGYENNHYLRAYFDNGDKLGCFENDECKIDLLSQSFSILSNVLKEKDQNDIISVVESNLVDKEESLIKNLNPAFEKSLNSPGRVMKYPKGVRKNGSQYNYSVIWYIKALIKLKQYDKAYSYYQLINPINRTKTSVDVEKYKVEPYVIAEDIYTNDLFNSQGGFTWNNSSSSLFYKVGIEEILGIKRRGDKLMIEPHLPKNIKEFEIQYNYLDSLYEIKVKIGKEDKILINSKKIDTNYIPLEVNKKYNIEVYIKN